MPPETDDPALDAVASTVVEMDPAGVRWAGVVRHTFDMVYNGQETGRYRLDQLMKTEKTHVGSLFEINAQREFGFDDGVDKLDFNIAGVDVDAKYSQTGNWMLPPEVINELALVGMANDESSTWSLGVVRVTEDLLRPSLGNRDSKRSLSVTGKQQIRWLWWKAALPVNILLQLPRADVDHMLGLKFGTRRTNELFRRAEGQLVSRTVVSTVSRQLDALKRVRYNGGARSALQDEGFLIFSGSWQAHRDLARELGVPAPGPKEFVSVRVVPDAHGVLIGTRRWRRAGPDEDVMVPAPLIAEPTESAGE